MEYSAKRQKPLVWTVLGRRKGNGTVNYGKIDETEDLPPEQRFAHWSTVGLRPVAGKALRQNTHPLRNARGRTSVGRAIRKPRFGRSFTLPSDNPRRRN